MEIARVQLHADKINRQLDCVLSDNPHLYAKTQHKYKDLAISLLDSVNKITSILEVDSLSQLDDKSAEFDGIDFATDDLAAALDRAHDNIDALTSFVSPDSVNNINKLTLQRYGSLLEVASSHDFGYVEANDCAYLLNMWFRERFTNNASSNFKYNVAYLPNWITSIILTYGKYLHNHDISSFSLSMNKWCHSLASSKSVWAVPYEVHAMSKSSTPHDYTVEAVLIGDLLMDDVLYLLTEEHEPDIAANLSCYPVASIVKANNPALLPTIKTRLANRSKLCKAHNLTISERRN